MTIIQHVLLATAITASENVNICVYLVITLTFSHLLTLAQTMPALPLTIFLFLPGPSPHRAVTRSAEQAVLPLTEYKSAFCLDGDQVKVASIYN